MNALHDMTNPVFAQSIEVSRPSVFDGLYSYEKVMLVCGVVLFAALLAMLAYLVVKKRDFKALLAAFFFPIAMIGYPALQKLGFDAEESSLDSKERAVRTNPGNTQARAALEATAAKVARRSPENPQIQLRLARAFSALNERAVALTHVEQALRVQPDLPEAVALRNQLRRP